jgi:hypothetical protein
MAKKSANSKKARDNGKKAEKNTEIICNHNIETSAVEMRLVFDCKECQLEANLKNQQCLKGVLAALADNYNADNVVLSDYAELRYTGPSMKMLKTLIDLANEIDNLSLRNPPRTYFRNLKTQSAKEKRRTTCNNCKANPQVIFPHLKKMLLEDIEAFYNDFLIVSKSVKQIRAPECQACVRTTEEALVYIFNITENFRAFLYYEGFSVVI